MIASIFTLLLYTGFVSSNYINDMTYELKGDAAISFIPSKIVFCASGHTLHANANGEDFDLYEISTASPYATLTASYSYGSVSQVTWFHPIESTNYVIIATADFLVKKVDVISPGAPTTDDFGSEVRGGGQYGEPASTNTHALASGTFLKLYDFSVAAPSELQSLALTELPTNVAHFLDTTLLVMGELGQSTVKVY
jgi:hypothetical protein